MFLNCILLFSFFKKSNFYFFSITIATKIFKRYFPNKSNLSLWVYFMIVIFILNLFPIYHRKSGLFHYKHHNFMHIAFCTFANIHTNLICGVLLEILSTHTIFQKNRVEKGKMNESGFQVALFHGFHSIFSNKTWFMIENMT